MVYPHYLQNHCYQKNHKFTAMKKYSRFTASMPAERWTRLMYTSVVQAIALDNLENLEKQ